MIYPIFNRRCPIPTKIKIKIFVSYNRTVLTYTGEAFSYSLPTGTNSAIQKIALCLILKCSSFVCNQTILNSSRIQLLPDVVIKNSKRLFYKNSTFQHIHIHQLGRIEVQHPTFIKIRPFTWSP